MPNKEKVVELEEVLRGLVGHKVGLTYTPRNDSLRETDGILLEVTPDYIKMQLFDEYGCPCSFYYLNRHGCILHSFVDCGTKDDTEAKTARGLNDNVG